MPSTHVTSANTVAHRINRLHIWMSLNLIHHSSEKLLSKAADYSDINRQETDNVAGRFESIFSVEIGVLLDPGSKDTASGAKTPTIFIRRRKG